MTSQVVDPELIARARAAIRERELNPPPPPPPPPAPPPPGTRSTGIRVDVAVRGRGNLLGVGYRPASVRYSAPFYPAPRGRLRRLLDRALGRRPAGAHWSTDDDGDLVYVEGSSS